VIGGWWLIYSQYNLVPSGYDPSAVSPIIGFKGLKNEQLM